jgi:hypothetical protein
VDSYICILKALLTVTRVQSLQSHNLKIAWIWYDWLRGKEHKGKIWGHSGKGYSIQMMPNYCHKLYKLHSHCHTIGWAHSGLILENPKSQVSTKWQWMPPPPFGYALICPSSFLMATSTIQPFGKEFSGSKHKKKAWQTKRKAHAISVHKNTKIAYHSISLSMLIIKLTP